MSEIEFEECSLIESILKRRSVRTYKNLDLPNSQLSKILNFIQTTKNDSLESNNLSEIETFKNIRIIHVKFQLGSYTWLINGPKDYLAIIGPKKDYDQKTLMQVGYFLQKVILYATTIGVGTCWIGGKGLTIQTPNENNKNFNSETEVVYCITPMGIIEPKMRFIGKLTYYIFTKRRKENKKLFFNKEFGKPINVFGKYEKCWEAVRWAPSGSNKQRWRVIKDENEFHFFTTKGSRWYSNIDMGICLCNWRIACEHVNIKGDFVIKENIKDYGCKKNKVLYMITFVEKE